MTFKKWLKNNTEYKKKDPLSITHINCSDNNITSLSGIEHLTKLEYLDCSNNQLTSLAGIEHLIKLEFLDCSDNNITSLVNIERFTNLKYLFLTSGIYFDYEGMLELIKKIKYKRILKQTFSSPT